MENFDELATKIESSLEHKDVRGAFGHLRPWLAYPGRVDARNWSRAMEFFAQIAREIAGEGLAELCLVAVDVRDVQGLYELGYELIEQELYDVAATVLARAVEQRLDLPGLMSELVAALEREGQHDEACRWILRAPETLKNNYMLRYLLAWNTLMNGDLGGLRAQLPTLARPGDFNESLLYDRLQRILVRAEGFHRATALDRKDLRGWHFVLHCSLLLRVSPHGFAEGMCGRYAFTQDSELRCREAIERLRIALKIAEIAITRVYALPDRDSTILAHATARVLGLSMEPWDSNACDEPGVVVAYDLANAGHDLTLQLQPHRPGQVLWSHACQWTTDHPVAADIVTYFYQYNVAPWAAREWVDKETGEPMTTMADSGTPEEIGARIASLAFDDLDLKDQEVFRRFVLDCIAVREMGEQSFSVLREHGLRSRFWTGGPVRSSRFR
jgi:tetratricopeptide (TPR) repeat protein